MNKIQMSYYLALGCYCLQFVLLGMSTFQRPEGVETGTIVSGIVLVAIKGIPWLVLVPGLLMRNARIMAWMSYVCLLYFIIWTLGAFSVNDSSVASYGVVVTIIQFIAAALHTRWRKQLPTTH